MAKPLATPSFLGTFGLIFLAVAALFAADTFLARMERTESAVEAARLFDQGRVLMQRGNNTAAIERIQDALSIERTNRYYQQALAQAQLAAGKTADAESTLSGLLQSDPTDALANLIMGRVQEKLSRFPEAISYFHRAIYGKWSQNAAQNSLQARFELIDLLAQRDSKEDLLAELLPVQDQVPRDLKTRMRMGHLFLRAGSPARAADIFRGIIQEIPTNGEAYAGLGESQFAESNYRVAARNFETALRLAPDDQSIRKRRDLCNQLLALDPTIRGLSPLERLNRSRKLVELTLHDTSQCADPTPPPETRALLDQAAKALKTRVSPASEGEVTEFDLDIAEQLWQARAKVCKSAAPPDSPLALVMGTLAH